MEYQKNTQIRNHQLFHTRAHLIKVYGLCLHKVRFLTKQYMWCKYAPLSYLPKTPLSALVVGYEKGNAFGEEHTLWVIQEYPFEEKFERCFHLQNL